MVAVIIYRYLSRQLLTATLAVSFVLTLILVGGRLLKYMEDAAQGRLSGDVLLALVGYRLPGFLGLILPLGLLLGILLAYGRLYLESEMTVLAACGIGPGQIIKKTMIPVLGMTAAVALMSLYLAPWGATHTERINHEQKNQSAFETLTPGYFLTSNGASRVTYARNLSSDRRQMEQLFIAEDQQNKWVIVTAQLGIKMLDSLTDTQYLQLENGRRYEGLPGHADFRVTDFKQYRIQLDPPVALQSVSKLKAESTRVLWHKNDILTQAELQWRLSMPLLVPIVALMAIPLSRVNARQGRYLKILPSILLYLSYLILLSNGKSAIEKQKISAAMGLWWIHGLFFFIAITLNIAPLWKIKYRQLKQKWRPPFLQGVAS